MLRLSEEDLHAIMARRKACGTPNEANPKPSSGIPNQDAAISEASTGGRIDEDAHKQKGGVVMLPYPISANRYWRNFRGRMVVSSEAKIYKAKVKLSFLSVGGYEPTLCPVALNIKLHPKLTTKGKASRTLIDLDNCIKVCLDALQGVLYVNDKQVKKLTAEVGEPVLGGGLSVGITK